jgi:hypothetical protein
VLQRSKIFIDQDRENYRQLCRSAILLAVYKGSPQYAAPTELAGQSWEPISIKILLPRSRVLVVRMSKPAQAEGYVVAN